MKSFIVKSCRHAHRLIKVRQVNSYIIFNSLRKSTLICILPRYNEHFDYFHANLLYIKVFDLMNPRYNERISLVPW